MSHGPLVVDWKGLRNLGWNLSRAHTWRMISIPIMRTIGSPDATSWARTGILTRIGASPTSWPISRPTVSQSPKTGKLSRSGGGRACTSRPPLLFEGAT